MGVSPLAGKPAPESLLIDVDKLVSAYYSVKPDISITAQRVSFGTSGHRGSSEAATFNEAHILAISQAIAEYRASQGVTGPLFLGKDTHALSAPAQRTALEVLVANGVNVTLQSGDGFTPTPVISHAILTYNRGRKLGFADGIVVTPSHNPPADGGFKYNPTHAGPAESSVTGWIEKRANELLGDNNAAVRRVPYRDAMQRAHSVDFVATYVNDLPQVVDLDAIRSAGLRIGVDPLGGSSVDYWDRISQVHELKLEVVNRAVDPTFRFMTVDHDGKIRMDCSSPFAMAKLVGLKNDFPVAFGNDPDADRHGIVTPSAGLMNPNHFLAVSVEYLLTHRPRWSERMVVAKTLVSSAVIDRVVRSLSRSVIELPVGFKFFSDGLLKGETCFAGEESAGASFLRMDGTVWTTDKDGLILNLLAAEMTAKTGRDPGELYEKITSRLGVSYYVREDAPATVEQKAKLARLSPDAVEAGDLAGDRIELALTKAPGNGVAIGGLKVTTRNGWFAARPSGTEDVYKIYAESFVSQAHLAQIVDEARGIVASALGKGQS